MSIYEKLAKVQMELMNMDIRKSGWNNFRKYHYYELDDLLPCIFKACFKEQITVYFTFNNDEGVLHLKSWEKEGQVGTRDELSVRVPFPELNNGINNDVIQDIGKSITYLKRYLLMNTFLITEYDKVDCDCDCHDHAAKKKAPVKKESKKGKVKSKSGEKPEKLKNAINLAKNNGGITADNVCYQADMLLKKGVVSKDQSEAIKTYVHEHGVEV